MTNLSRKAVLTIAASLSLSSVAGCSTESAPPSSPKSDDKQISSVVEDYMNRVYKEGDAESAIELTCGYMTQLTYNLVNTPKQDYQSAEKILIEAPEIIDSPKQMPKASVRISQNSGTNESSAFLTLLKIDNEWKICDQTEKNRIKDGL